MMMPEIDPVSVVETFREIVPFNALPQSVLKSMAENMSSERFAKGSVILEQDGRPCSSLYVVKKGAVVKSISKGGLDVFQEYRTEGEFFGSASVINRTGPAFTVKAHEDTECYLIPRNVIDDLMQNHVGFHEHFAIRVSKLAYRLKKVQTGVFAPETTSDTVVFRSEGYLFNVTAGEIMKSMPVTSSPDDKIVDVAKRMEEKAVGSVIIVDPQNHPLGIVTIRDMTNRVLAEGVSSSLPISEVMSAPVIHVEPDVPCFSALLVMARHKCHHICVVEEDKLKGIVSQHDLVMLQGSSPLAVITDIHEQTTIDGLVDLIQIMDRTVNSLLVSGVSAKDIVAFISECNDHLTERIIALTEESLREEGFGDPPVDYCWLALGSEGRREQTLRTDQDNAIVYYDPEPGTEKEAHEYFLALAKRVVSGLERCGFPLCKGGIMASNPKWCQPEAMWQRYFAGWINTASSEDLLKSTIFFDFRPLTGSFHLAQRLRSFLNKNIQGSLAFLRHLATNALFNGPPLGFFRTLVVEKAGVHKNELNLKMSGLVPIVDAMRVLSLSQQGNVTNTLNRLEFASRQKLISKEMAENIKEAYNFIMLLRINNHNVQKEMNLEPSNYVDPKRLSKLQQKSLIESFHVIRDLQGEVESLFPESFL
jgi:CBS domain-containing protein